MKISTRYLTSSRFFPAFFLLLIWFLSPGTSRLISAQTGNGVTWSLDSNQIVVGQTATLTIRVEGSDRASVPPLTAAGLDVSFQGAGPRNSTSITSINGQTRTSVRRAWEASWYVRAGAAGRYSIGPLDWDVNGVPVTLPRLDLVVAEAQTSNLYLLNQKLSAETTLPGVPVTYTLTWLLGQNAQNPVFILPVLDNPRLGIVEDSLKPPPGEFYTIEYKGKTVYAKRGEVNSGGRRYSTLTLSLELKPEESGTFDLSATVVAFEGVVGTRRAYDFFGNLRDEPRFGPLVSRANPLRLRVQELPQTGKPDPFSGIIGKLTLEWEGAAGPYRVGEPIRLVLKLGGSTNKPRLDLDYMVTTALRSEDFLVSSATEEAQQGEREFVFRARRAGQLVIPSLQLNYFNPETSRYEVAQSQPLRLTIQAAGTAGSGGLADTPAFAGQNAASGGAGLANGSTVAPGENGAGANEAGAAGAGLAGVEGSGASQGLELWALDQPGLLSTATPWFWLVVPLPVASTLMMGWGWWWHSALRARRKEKQAWRRRLEQALGPDDTHQPQSGELDVIEAGRTRMLSLLHLQPYLEQDLRKRGVLQLLERELPAWDRAYFSPHRQESGKVPPPEFEYARWQQRWTRLVADIKESL